MLNLPSIAHDRAQDRAPTYADLVRGNVTRRSKDRWQLRVDIGTGEGGRRRQRARTITARTKREADAVLQRWLVELGHGAEIGSDASVLDLCEAHLSQARLAATTAEDWHRAVRQLLPGWLAAMPVWKVRPSDLDRAYAELLAAGRSAHRVRRLHTVLSSAFGRAVRWQWIVRNPARDAEPPVPDRANVRPPEHDEARRLVAAVGGLRWRGCDAEDMVCALRLDIATGARRGEICGLRWGDVNLDTGTLVIARAAAWTPTSGLIFKATKKDRVRVVALADVTVAALRARRARAIALALELGVPFGVETPVFTGPTGLPWLPNFLTQAFDRIRKSSGVTGVRLHDVRHLQATHLLAEGIEARTVAGRLGHAKVSTTTDVYAAFVPARDREAARLADQILDPPIG